MDANNSIKLGDLLVACGAIAEPDLNSAIAMAGRTGLPLGRMLIASGLLSYAELEMALRLQKTIRSIGLPVEVAVDAYRYAKFDNLPFEKALARAGVIIQTEPYSKLGTFLCDSGVITPAQLEEAHNASLESGVPIGKLFCSVGLISSRVLSHALDLQTRLRDQNVSKDDAVREMRRFISSGDAQAMPPEQIERRTAEKATTKPHSDAVSSTNRPTVAPPNPVPRIGTESEISLPTYSSKRKVVLPPPAAVPNPAPTGSPTAAEAASAEAKKPTRPIIPRKVEGDTLRLNVKGPHAPTLRRVKLGELLLMSGVVTEIDVMNALEVSLTENKSIGEALVGLQVVQRAFLEKAIELQESVNAGYITVIAAAQSLAHLSRTTDATKLGNETDMKAMGNIVKLAELLTRSNIAAEQDISYAMDLVGLFPSLLGRMLVVGGVIDESILLAALRSQFLVNEKLLSVDDAVRALQYAYEKSLTIDDAMSELGLGAG